MSEDKKPVQPAIYSIADISKLALKFVKEKNLDSLEEGRKLAIEYIKSHGGFKKLESKGEPKKNKKKVKESVESDVDKLRNDLKTMTETAESLSVRVRELSKPKPKKKSEQKSESKVDPLAIPVLTRELSITVSPNRRNSVRELADKFDCKQNLTDLKE